MKGISSVISRIAKSTDNLGEWKHRLRECLVYFPEWKVYEHSESFTVDFVIGGITEDMPMKGISSVISRIAKSTDNLGEWKHRFRGMPHTFPLNGKYMSIPLKFTVDFVIYNRGYAYERHILGYFTYCKSQRIILANGNIGFRECLIYFLNGKYMSIPEVSPLTLQYVK